MQATPRQTLSAERMPNGARIDMGAFGGTPQASMSRWPLAGDLDQDGVVDFRDLAILADGLAQQTANDSSLEEG